MHSSDDLIALARLGSRVLSPACDPPRRGRFVPWSLAIPKMTTALAPSGAAELRKALR